MTTKADPGAPPPPETLRQRFTTAPPEWFRRFRASLSIPGLLVGTLFFAISLTPSLLPRAWVIQGLLSGLCLSAGYGIGVAYRWLWGYLELPLPRDRVRRWGLWVAAAICSLVALFFLWQASSWQDSVRALMELDPVETTRPIRVGILAFLLFAALLGITRLFHSLHHLVVRRLGKGMPRRVANVVGLVIVVMVFWAVLDGVVFQQALRFADETFERVDARIEAETEAPTDPEWTGGAESLVQWSDLGRRGREFVAGTTREGEITRLTGQPAMEPLRVYVGLNTAETPGQRAGLALAELERRGAFDRSILVIVIPTGTGWVDPAALSTLEYLHHGDVASVAIQYSYLPSWLTLLSEPQYGVETAHALFDAIYGHWTGLPADARPELYLHGVSLGAHNSQLSADLYDVIADPFQGALWVGPPFRSETWQDLTRQRHPESPPWLPRFRDGSVVRFMNQWETSHPPETPWGPLRIIYLQYASDPITFFEPESFYQPPGWLDDPRGPDVSERVRWYPIVTALQLLGDLFIADSAPTGYGHVYAAEHYVDAWLAVSDPEGWTPSGIERLKRHLDEEALPPDAHLPAPTENDAHRIADLVFEGSDEGERVVITVVNDEGEPATGIPEIRVEEHRGGGFVRLGLPGISYVDPDATERTFDGSLVRDAFVLWSAEGRWIDVDLHLEGPAHATVRVEDEPTRIVVDFEARKGAPAPPFVRGQRVVLLEPRASGAVELESPTVTAAYPLRVAGYTRTFEAQVVIRLEHEGDMGVDTFTTATAWADAWGHFDLVIDEGPQGDVVLHVGEHSARDGTWEGVELPLIIRREEGG